MRFEGRQRVATPRVRCERGLRRSRAPRVNSTAGLIDWLKCMIRLLSAAQWRQAKQMEAVDAKRRQLEQTRQLQDVVQLLERLDDECRVYGQQAFNAWLHQRRLTTGPPVVNRLDVTTRLCGRNHSVSSPSPRVMTHEIFSFNVRIIICVKLFGGRI